MLQLARDFLERSKYARTPEQLRDAVSAVIAPLDLFAFAFLALPEGAKPLLISTYPPDWTDHYIAQDYQRRDPVILRSSHVFDLFTWDSQLSKRFSPGARDFFCEAEAFNIRCGITIPIHDWPGGLAAMTFATDCRRHQYISCLTCNALSLLLVTLNFRNHLRRMLEPVRLIEGAELTPREYEILGWAAEGKSSTDIAPIVDVSHRIVARDLERVRAKLGVRSINQAVAVYAAYVARVNHGSH
jgi:DNA-binding CsgD family transcriptional regulator